MGSGKSTVGRRVAQRLGWDFIDTDHWIEAREGMPVSKIFETKGESGFRDLETRVLAEALAHPHAVVSTGGGAILNPDNLRAILERSHAVCLWMTPEEAYARTRHHTHRPLLQTADPLARIREIMEQREPLYRQAHYIIDTTGRGIPDICESILRYVQHRDTENAATPEPLPAPDKNG